MLKRPSLDLMTPVRSQHNGNSKKKRSWPPRVLLTFDHSLWGHWPWPHGRFSCLWAEWICETRERLVFFCVSARVCSLCVQSDSRSVFVFAVTSLTTGVVSVCWDTQRICETRERLVLFSLWFSVCVCVCSNFSHYRSRFSMLGHTENLWNTRAFSVVQSVILGLCLCLQ